MFAPSSLIKFSCYEQGSSSHNRQKLETPMTRCYLLRDGVRRNADQSSAAAAVRSVGYLLIAEM